jgi:hypothetical protein
MPPAARPLCFIIGPIGKDGTLERKHSDLLLNAVLKHVLQGEEFAYQVKRADEDADPGMIGDRIVSDIVNAELAVADLTDLNPNVFYELGIRHATGKSTVHIAKSGTTLPFDTVALRTIFIDLTDWNSIEDARKRLAESVRAVRAEGYKVSNPITHANASFKMHQSDDPRDRLVADMHERLSKIGIMGPRFRSPPQEFQESQEPSKLNDLITQFRAVVSALRRNGASAEQIQEELRRVATAMAVDLAKLEITDSEVAFETSTGGTGRFGTDAKTQYWSTKS